MLSSFFQGLDFNTYNKYQLSKNPASSAPRNKWLLIATIGCKRATLGPLSFCMRGLPEKLYFIIIEADLLSCLVESFLIVWRPYAFQGSVVFFPGDVQDLIQVQEQHRDNRLLKG